MMAGKGLESGPSPDKVVVEVERAGPHDAAGWDEFVESHPEGRFCHLWGFRQCLENTYGYRCVYLKFQSGGKLLGVFPSIAVARRGGYLISQPFNEYGGPLVQNASQQPWEELTRLLLDVAEEEGCQTIEVRGGLGCEAAVPAREWTRIHLHSYAVLQLDKVDVLWRKSLTNEARKGVNRARKSGLGFEIRKGLDAVQDPFYSLYLISMKRLGVPPHSKLFFNELAKGIGNRLVASWAINAGAPVAILLGAVTGKRVHIFVIASDPDAWATRPSDLAHWELINWATGEGMRVFDFGSARYEGQIQFKKKWGVSFSDYYYYLISHSDSVSRRKAHTAGTSSRIMAATASFWRLAVPLSWTRYLGPPIRRHLTK